MQIAYPDPASFGPMLKEAHDNSLDFVVFVTAALEPTNVAVLIAHLAECVRALKNEGLLFVQGRPDDLPELGVFLDRHLHFKYWIAIESTPQLTDNGLPSVHAALLLFTKGNGRFNVNQVRFPHRRCAFCGKPLKDWGGKTHLMHPNGYVISDVWSGLPPADNTTQISAPVLDTILRLVDSEPPQGDERVGEIKGIIGPKEGIGRDLPLAESALQSARLGFGDPAREHGDTANDVGNRLVDVVHRGDVLDILKRYPDNSIDLVFADPPYNLDKQYNAYDDEQEDERYVEWCSAWLAEYARILKPTGSLYVLNLPRWTMYHAAFLNQHLHFQNWIVWDALSEPRGKLMPAHYGLLFYTKRPAGFTFNYDEVGQIDARTYCLRASCIRWRKALGADDKEPLTDVWRDIHRIKHRRDRDYHPCQLPEALMERIIRLSTNPGDIVLDAFSGAGTTAVTAVKLGRRYVASDVDAKYVKITREKVVEVERQGYVSRKRVSRPQQKYTKKELQLELRDLATRLGRLPTPDDVRTMSKYDAQIFLDMFQTWGKALKAAKLEALA